MSGPGELARMSTTQGKGVVPAPPPLPPPFWQVKIVVSIGHFQPQPDGQVRSRVGQTTEAVGQGEDPVTAYKEALGVVEATTSLILEGKEVKGQ